MSSNEISVAPGEPPVDQTRAPGRPRGRPPAPSPSPRVVAIELPETDRRVPLVLARVAVGPFTVAVGVSLPRSGHLTARPPLSALGAPAVATDPPGLWAEIEAAAVAAVLADPAALRHLEHHRERRHAARAGAAVPPGAAPP